jgi:uncharacterized Zn-binding protein involved in type VI secretion
MDIFTDTTGEFVVKVDGETKTYTDYKDVPDKVETVFKFTPNIPEPGPSGHTVQEHELIAEWNNEMRSLLEGSDGTPPATRIGDADVPHCSGMVRAEGSPDVFINNIPWSRQTDVNTPHLLAADVCPVHTAPIRIGSPTVFVNGLGGGRVGDDIAGCTNVAEGSPNVFCGPNYYPL